MASIQVKNEEESNLPVVEVEDGLAGLIKSLEKKVDNMKLEIEARAVKLENENQELKKEVVSLKTDMKDFNQFCFNKIGIIDGVFDHLEYLNGVSLNDLISLRSGNVELTRTLYDGLYYEEPAKCKAMVANPSTVGTSTNELPPLNVESVLDLSQFN